MTGDGWNTPAAGDRPAHLHHAIARVTVRRDRRDGDRVPALHLSRGNGQRFTDPGEPRGDGAVGGRRAQPDRNLSPERFAQRRRNLRGAAVLVDRRVGQVQGRVRPPIVVHDGKNHRSGIRHAPIVRGRAGYAHPEVRVVGRIVDRGDGHQAAALQLQGGNRQVPVLAHGEPRDGRAIRHRGAHLHGRLFGRSAAQRRRDSGRPARLADRVLRQGQRQPAAWDRRPPSGWSGAAAAPRCRSRWSPICAAVSRGRPTRHRWRNH